MRGAVAVALVLAACAPAADPCARANQPVNIFTLLANTTTGSYDACLDDLRGDLAAAQLRATTLRAQAAALEAEAARLDGERRAAAERLAAINQRQAAAVARITALDRSRAVERAALDQVLATERDVSGQIADQNATRGADPARAAALEAEVGRLESQLDQFQF